MPRVSGLEEAKDAKRGRLKHVRSQRKARLAETARLLRAGRTHKQVAKELGVHERTVARDVTILASLWRRTMPEDFNEARKLMEARLLELDALAAAEYERSKQPIDKEVVERDAVPGKPPKDWPVTKVKTVRTGRTGDPSILGTRLGILRDLRKMLGLDVK